MFVLAIQGESQRYLMNLTLNMQQHFSKIDITYEQLVKN